MTFTYTGDPSVSDRDKVRFLIGDTISAEAHFQDEEIAWLITQWGDVYTAARAGAEVLSGRFAAKANTSRSVGDLSVSESFTAQADQFRALADRIAQMAQRQAPATPIANTGSLTARQFSVGLTDFE